jgi:hypothetical protein
MSGWRLACPACGAPSLLPEGLARTGARIRCPGCGAIFAAAEPGAVEACARGLEGWLDAEPGGRDAVLRARAAGTFWREHGTSLLDWREAGGGGADADTFRAALARVLGPGRQLF